MKKFLFGFFILVLLTTMIFSGCTPDDSGVRLTFSGGSVSGTSGISASGFAGVAKKFLGIEPTVIIHIPATVPTTVHDGISDIGISQEPVNMDAYTGTGTYAGKTPIKDIRTLTNMDSMSSDIIVPVNSNIKSMKDLIGKRVGVGKSGSLGALFFESQCKANGIDPKKDINILYVGQDDISSGLTLGKMDAGYALEPKQHPTFEQLDMTFPVKLVQLSDAELNATLKEMPYCFIATIPKTYHGEGTTYKAIFLNQQVIASTRVSADIAYGIVKNWMENPDFMKNYRDAMREAIVDGTVKTATESINWGLPYHAGSYKYFKEKGWKVPAERIPPEAK